MTDPDESGYDPYPDGACHCGGCIGMGPCDDDLGRADDDDFDDDAAAECPCGEGCWDDDFDDCSREPRRVVTVDTGGLT